MLQRLKTHNHVDQIALGTNAAASINQLPENVLRGSVAKILSENWQEGGLLIFIGSIGAVIRLINPFITNKELDPAVIVVDSSGINIVPLLGCHKAGGEEFAIHLAAELGGNAILTGHSRTKQLLSLDSFGEAWGWKRSGTTRDWKELMIHQANYGSIAVEQSEGSDYWMTSEAAFQSLSDNLFQKNTSLKDFGIGIIKNFKCSWHTPSLWIGIGCERGTSFSLLERSLNLSLLELNLAKESIAGISTIELKNDEQALLSLAEENKCPINFYTIEELSEVSVPNPSQLVFDCIGVSSVAEASSLLAAGEGSSLLMEKKTFQRQSNEKGACTISISKAIKPYAPKRGELHIVGIGPGKLSSLTDDAKFALTRSIIWIGYHRYLDLIEQLRRNDQIRLDRELTYEKDRCLEAIELARQGIKVTLVSSGDSGVYGMAGLALELLLDKPSNERPFFQIHPGISSVYMAAARVGSPLMNDFCTISLSDRLTPWERIESRIHAAATGDFVIALYNPRSIERDWQLKSAIEIVKTFRPLNTPVIIARQVGRSDENIEFYTLDDFNDEKVDMLSLVLIGNNSSYIKDGYFITPRGY